MRPLAGLVCASALAAVGVANGQGMTVRGVAYDSLHSRPLAGAMMALGGYRATSDTGGRFHLDAVAPGSYRLTIQHDAIDRLGMSAIVTEVRVTDGREVITVAIPSFATLWRLECGLTPPTRDTGFVFGSVRALKAAQPVTVSASWIDLAVAGTGVSQKLRTIEVTADSSGNFSLCGVPTGTGLSIRAVGTDSSWSGLFDMAPMDSERVVRRDLGLVSRLVEPDGMIEGRVTDASGGAIATAEVTLINAGATVRSGAGGAYSFAKLSPGTYRLYVRKIGYSDVERDIDVEAGARRQHDIVLAKVTLLDSMRVVGRTLARDEAMREFEEHRARGLGKFLTMDELEKSRGSQLSSLIRQWPGVSIPSRPLRRGDERDPETTRGPKSINGSGACKIALYLDGVRLGIPFDQVPPESLAGLEYYPSPATTPVEYLRLNHQCGVILMHSRYKTGK